MTQPPPWLKTGTHNQAPRGNPPHRPHVVFVCTGNICRSAFAACYFGASPATREVDVVSAGTMAVVGHAIDASFSGLAADLGLDARGHRSRQLNGRILKKADILIVFAPEHHDWIFANYPESADRVLALGQTGAVLSYFPNHLIIPWWTLTNTVMERRPLAQPSDWISDPYGRGRQAARRTARVITENLDLLTSRVSWRNR